MAVNRNSLTDVGPITGQLKSEFSILEATQINAARGLGGISPSAGRISGDVSNSLKNVNNTTQGKFAIGSMLAASMESVGITNQNSAQFLSTTVSNSLANKLPLNKHVASTPLDLSISENRFPSLRLQSPNETIRKKQESLNGFPNSTFPVDLTDKAVSYVELRFNEYKRSIAFAPGTLDESNVIRLPLPENYNQTFTLRYDQKDQGFFGDVAQSDVGQRILNQLQTGVNRETLGNVVDEIRNTDDRAALGTGSDVALRAGYQMLDAFSDVVGGIAQQTAGTVPNPHSTIFFKGVDLRSFNWTWRLVPRSEEEASIIREILQKLRNSILPKKENNMLKYPDLMQPVIKGPVDLGKFKKCLVKNMAINYSAEGASAFFRDGHPVAIQLALEFQEVEILTADDQGN